MGDICLGIMSQLFRKKMHNAEHKMYFVYRERLPRMLDGEACQRQCCKDREEPAWLSQDSRVYQLYDQVGQNVGLGIWCGNARYCIMIWKNRFMGVAEVASIEAHVGV